VRKFVSRLLSRPLLVLAVALILASGAGVAYAECEGIGGSGTYIPPAPTVTPSTVEAGGVITVTAYALSRSEAYDVVLRSSSPPWIIGEVRPDFTGGFPPTSVGIPTSVPAGNYRVTLESKDGAETTDSTPLTVVTTGYTGETLRRYAPQLRYDAQGSYRADAADIITDSYFEGVRTNRLKMSNGETLAVADPTLVGPPYTKPTQLTLGLLGYPYHESSTFYYAASASDYLDEEGDGNDYPRDAAYLHGQASYANRVYGRFKRHPNGEAVLQYWLFYYYNSKSLLGNYVHEGDWEMVQVHLDASDQPRRATYAQHNGGERCDWPQVQRTTGGQPIVYVAEGSHASYFSSGTHLISGASANDSANGNAAAEAVPQTLIDITAPPRWIAWPGKWGGSDASPQGPAHGGNKPKWDDPLAWASGVTACTENQTQATTSSARGPARDALLGRALAPPPPRTVVARRRGDRVVINYRFGPLPESRARRPRTILTSVDPVGGSYPPLTIRSRVRSIKGRVNHSLGRLAEKSPFRVLVSAEAKTGMRSRIVSVELR
jgi:hypothetical protein